MTDRELLEYAAKAAGIEGRWMTKGDGDLWLFRNDFSDPWNPLTDDGDALRLAVKLGLSLDIFGPTTTAIRHDIDGATQTNMTDRYAATRRAIVRAAAEIGRSMT